ncbi:hypothetical protein PVD02_006195, partial [Pseudomonas aeruginosa]
GYHHSSPGLPEFTTVTRVPALSGATIDEFAAIGAAVPARASPGPATPTAAGKRSGIAGSNAPCSTYAMQASNEISGACRDKGEIHSFGL